MTDGDAQPTGDSQVIDLRQQGGSNQSGTATLTPRGDSTRVKIVLKHPSGEPQPAHIHWGICGEHGEIEHTLNKVENGVSETVVDTDLDFLLGGGDAAFAIDVHESASQRTVVACGTLSHGMPEYG